MARVEQITLEAQAYLERHPNASAEQVREHLKEEFLVSKNREVAFLRSRLWPLALLTQCFRSLFSSRQTDQERIEHVMQQIEVKPE